MTLENIPDEVYQRLQASARSHRRTISSEAIACLEAALIPEPVTPAVHLARTRALREILKARKFKAKEIDELKREGRE